MSEQTGLSENLLAMKAELEALGCKVTITENGDDDVTVEVVAKAWMMTQSDTVRFALLFELFDKISSAASDQLQKTPTTHNARTLRHIETLAQKGMASIQRPPGDVEADHG